MNDRTPEFVGRHGGITVLAARGHVVIRIGDAEQQLVPDDVGDVRQLLTDAVGVALVQQGPRRRRAS